MRYKTLIIFAEWRVCYNGSTAVAIFILNILNYWKRFCISESVGTISDQIVNVATNVTCW